MSKRLVSDFGRRLRLYRTARGMTQRDVGAVIHYSNKVISDWERLRKSPTTEQVSTFAEQLNVPFDWLCGWGPDFSWEKTE